MPSKSKSASPARASSAGFDPMDYKDDAIALALVGGLIALTGGDALAPASYTSFLTGGDEKLPHLGFGTVLTLHTLNKCQNRGKTHWLADIVQCMLAVFAGAIALGLLSGKKSIGSAVMLGSEAEYTLVIICWYLCNHSIGGVVPNVWNLLNESPLGPAIQKVLALSTIAFTNGLVIEAAKPVAAHALNYSKIAVTPLIKAVMVGTAGSVIPSPADTTSAAANSALVLAVLVSTSCLTTLPVAGDIIAKGVALIPVQLAGSKGVVTLYTNLFAIRYFLGDALGAIGVPAIILDPLGNAVSQGFGLVNSLVTKVDA